MNFHADMMEKIKIWDLCKICDGAEAEGRGEWRAWVLIVLEDV